MQVGELLLALGLDLSKQQWDAGQAAINQLTLELRKLEVEAKLATTDVQKAMDTIGLSATKTAKKGLGDLVTAGDKVANRFKQMAVAAAGFFAISKVKGWVDEVSEMGGRVNELAQKTGLSRRAVQEFAYATSQGGASIEDFAGGTLTLSKGLEKLAQGKGKDLAEALRKIGISADDPAIKSRNLEQITYKVAAAFSQMEDSAYKSQIAMAIFGKSGATLIPTLNEGVSGLVKLREEAQTLGVVVEDEGIEQLANFGDEADRAKTALTGLKNQAIVAMMPALRDLVNGFTKWVSANRDVIRSNIQRAVATLIGVMRALGSVVAFAVKHWRALAVILTAGALFSAFIKLIKLVQWFKLEQTKAAVQSVANWAMILGPILLVAAAVVALGALIYKYRDQVRAALRRVAEFFSDLWDGIKGAARAVVDYLKLLWGGVKAAFTAVWDYIADKVNWVIDKIKWALNKLDVLGVGEFGASLDTSREVMQQELAEAGTDEGKLSAFRAKYRGVLPGEGGASMEPQIKLPDGRSVPLSEWRKMQGATGGPAGAAPTRSPATSRTTSSNITNTYQVNIDAKNADAKEVGSIVDGKLREHDERVRRQTAASLGIGGD